MRAKTFDPRKLDVAAFAKAAGELQGRCALPSMSRLSASVLAGGDAPEIAWQARGSCREATGRDPQIRLHLQAEARVPLTCQRCLEPFWEPLQVDRVIRFVPSETEAELLDEQTEEEDVLALPGKLDLTELLEDELILALPIVPRHASCPQPLAAGEEPAEPEADERAEAPAHPFAALAALRKGSGGS